MKETYNAVDDMPDYAKWVEVADSGRFSFDDYIHAQVLQGRITTDILGAVVGWLWPEFVEIDGLVVLASQVSKLPDLKSQGVPSEEVEYWCNFTNIDGVLPGIPVSFSGYLANVVKSMWGAKLQSEFPAKEFSVEIVVLKEQNELSVTFRQRS